MVAFLHRKFPLPKLIAESVFCGWALSAQQCAGSTLWQNTYWQQSTCSSLCWVVHTSIAPKWFWWHCHLGSTLLLMNCWCVISGSVSGCSVSPIFSGCSLITHERRKERLLRPLHSAQSSCYPAFAEKEEASPPQPRQPWGRGPVMDHLLHTVPVLWQRDVLHPPGQTGRGRICWVFQRGKSGNLGSSLSGPHKCCSLSATCAFQYSFWGHLEVDTGVGIFLPHASDAFCLKGSSLFENMLRLFYCFSWFLLSSDTVFSLVCSSSSLPLPFII